LREDGHGIRIEQFNDGLVAFIEPGGFRIFRLPISVAEQVVVDRRFSCTPLLPMLAVDGTFHLLAVAQRGVHLFQGTRYTFEPVDVPDLPQDVEQVLQIERGREVQFHQVGMHTHVGTNPPIYTANAEDGKKQTELTDFFSRIDVALNQVLHRAPAPLVFAGVEYLLPIFRAHSSQPQVMPDGIPGNPRLESPQELHAEAWKIVEPVFRQPLTDALAAFPERAVRHAATQDLAEVLQALQLGQVQTLFLQQGARQWGTFDPLTGAVQTHAERASGDEDLLESAAIQAILQRGDVFVLNRDEMPGSSPIAALFRFVLQPQPPAAG
jgi:hypothetical protein